MKKIIYVISFFSLIGMLNACQDQRDKPIDQQRQERNAAEPAPPGPSAGGGGSNR